MTSETKIEKFFCNDCNRITKHHIRKEQAYSFKDHTPYGIVGFCERFLIAECCGCEHVSLIKMDACSEDLKVVTDPDTGEQDQDLAWTTEIYPPVFYRKPPLWLDDLPDNILRDIAEEIYKSLQTESYYLATFGSRTMIDRLIVLTVGDQGSFNKGLNALHAQGKVSDHELEIIDPVIQAGHAAAHRGWSPSQDQINTILDTVEDLMKRLLVQPSLAKELEEAIPSRNTKKPTGPKPVPTISEKIEAAPKPLRQLYDKLKDELQNLGKDVVISAQKHYIAFRRKQNFASVQIYNKKNLIRIYLNIDPDTCLPLANNMRDVRKIGHYGTGHLEIVIKNTKDFQAAQPFLQQSYDNS